MRFFRLLAIYGIVIALFVPARLALAQAETPLKTVTMRIGPYPMVIHYYSEPLGGAALRFSIAPADASRAPTRYTVAAVPGATTNAVSVNARLEPLTNPVEGVRGAVNLPVSGQWLLDVTLDGPLGITFGDVPVLASAPPAIPEWLGWLIGLLPVWACIGVVLWAARRERAVGLTPAAKGS